MITKNENQKMFKEAIELALSLQNNGKKNLLEKYPDNHDILSLLDYNKAIEHINKAILIP